MVPEQVIAGMYRDQVQVKNLRKYINEEWLAHVLAPQPHEMARLIQSRTDAESLIIDIISTPKT